MKNNSLVGIYDLVSWENRHESGEITYPLGPDAKGVISYSPDGFVFVHIMANNRSNHTVGDLFGGDVSEIKASATTHISYFGTYTIEGSEVIHCVSVSSFPITQRYVAKRHGRNLGPDMTCKRLFSARTDLLTWNRISYGYYRLTYE